MKLNFCHSALLEIYRLLPKFYVFRFWPKTMDLKCISVYPPPPSPLPPPTSPLPPPADEEHPSIAVGDFTEKIALLRANDDEGLEDEYADVELDWTFTSYASKLNINRNKNRYVNIIPCESTMPLVKSFTNSTGV